MTMEMSSLTVGENTYEIVDETARERIDGIKVPTKTSELTNDSNFLTEHQDLSSYAKKTEIPKTPSDIGAEETGVAANKVAEHDVDTTSHNDIRLLIEGLTTRLNTLANSDDTTLDQMSEVVAYIKSNRTLIESVTTNKVNVSDIIDNLTTSVSNKPLSAKQGVELKKLIDAIKIPTKTSELTNDSGFLTQHQSLADYAKKTELPTKTSQLTNDSGFLTQHQSLSGYAKTADHYTKTESDNKYQPKGSYLTSVPSEYITETELNAKKYLTAVPSEYVTETELTAKGYATQTSVDNLSEEIVDLEDALSSCARKDEIPTASVESVNGKTDVVVLDAEDVGATTESWVQAKINDLKAQGVQQVPLFANSIEECTDTSKVYVLPDGEIYAYLETEVTTEGSQTPNFTNLFNTATIKAGYRYSLSSAAWKALSGANGIIVPVPASLVGKSWTIRIKPYNYVGYVYVYGGTSADKFTIDLNALSGTNGGEYSCTIPSNSCTYITFVVGDITDLVITANEEITYTVVEGGTEIVQRWEKTGHKFIPADYEDRIIELEAEVSELETTISKQEKEIASLKETGVESDILNGMEVFAPSPQLPADGSSTADFNADSNVITCNHIYTYIDGLVEKYPRYITKETMGKDESGSYDWNRYVLSKRCYDAWQKTNYPPMYAWVNGSTTIYSKSVSPRIGDTMYTTTYIGTSKGTVTAVSNANQTRTVGGVVYTRDSSKDVEPTLFFTETAYSPYYVGGYAGYKNGVYNSSKTKTSTIKSINNGTLTDASNNTYIRYPLGDRNGKFESIPAIVIGANEHGTGGDPAEPAIISARMIKDLCECVNANNPFLNLLKNDYMMVFCPVINPWGFSAPNKSYYNSNGVNLDRNLDTPAWGNDTSNPQGEYGGSEVEMQYFMNTLVASKTKIALANHGLGEVIDSSTGESKNAGHCHYMLGRNDSKYNDDLKAIGDTMASFYNLAFSDYGQAPPESYAKTRSYIAWIGAEGGAVEMNAREGFVKAGQGNLHTARVLEADYTLMLQFLHMLIKNAV